MEEQRRPSINRMMRTEMLVQESTPNVPALFFPFTLFTTLYIRVNRGTFSKCIFLSPPGNLLNQTVWRLCFLICSSTNLMNT